MYEFLCEHTDILANLITIVAPILYGMTWSHRNLANKIDKVTEEVKDIDRRICRIEGSLSSRDCCMLKDDHVNQRAE